MNPKFLLTFKEEETVWEEPSQLKITLAIAEKNWKKINPNTVSGMIGLYLIEKREGKLHYSPETIIAQTSFLPVKTITLETTVGGDNPILKGGYLIMPSTYDRNVQGTFILSVKCDRAFDLVPTK
eukprot:TRINITY_DN14156_c0_g2_i1.p1 TRINITY_DN14156_c0_g2~~TRINITY_DN14156_c0_g2_i1.p1  ORF type:complete len:125 (-),score=1.42 TRINITY_DN14156_c0_g2_i1:3-377(-)